MHVDLTAERIEAACEQRRVPVLRVLNRRGAAEAVTSDLARRYMSGALTS